MIKKNVPSLDKDQLIGLLDETLKIHAHIARKHQISEKSLQKELARQMCWLYEKLHNEYLKDNDLNDWGVYNFVAKYLAKVQSPHSYREKHSIETESIRLNNYEIQLILARIECILTEMPARNFDADFSNDEDAQHEFLNALFHYLRSLNNQQSFDKPSFIKC
ncbi:hypothetical protein Q9887_001397 [Vibrio fluvialis]|nr:hypothetical protein [Vibrio fluvialis]